METLEKEVSVIPPELVYDLGFDPQQGAVNSAGEANRLIWAIKHLEDKIDKLNAEEKQVIEEAVAFYAKRVESLHSTIDYLKGKIEAFMIVSEEESLSTPAGRCYYRSNKKREWADDETLVNFSKENHIPLNVKIAPLKSIIFEHVSKQSYPGIVEVTETRDFYVKPNRSESE